MGGKAFPPFANAVKAFSVFDLAGDPGVSVLERV